MFDRLKAYLDSVKARDPAPLRSREGPAAQGARSFTAFALGNPFLSRCLGARSASRCPLAVRSQALFSGTDDQSFFALSNSD